MAEVKRATPTHDILILHGGSKEALAYHIGFVITLISEQKMKALKSVFGIGASALLAVRLATTWPTIVKIMRQNVKRRTDELFRLLNDKLALTLASQTTDVWKLDIEHLVSEYSWPLESGDSDDEKSMDGSEWSLETKPTVLIGKNVPNSSSVCLLKSEFQTNALCEACGIETNNVRQCAPYVNIVQAFRTLYTVSGEGLRFIVSSPDPACAAKRFRDVDFYPMSPQVASSALEISATTLKRDVLVALRQLGHDDCHSRDLGVPNKDKAPSVMQTPRRKSSICSADTTDSTKSFKISKPNACAGLCSGSWFSKKNAIVIEDVVDDDDN